MSAACRFHVAQPEYSNTPDFAEFGPILPPMQGPLPYLSHISRSMSRQQSYYWRHVYRERRRAGSVQNTVDSFGAITCAQVPI